MTWFMSVTAAKVSARVEPTGDARSLTPNPSHFDRKMLLVKPSFEKNQVIYIHTTSVCFGVKFHYAPHYFYIYIYI